MMPFAATWMQLEVIILSEISQKEKYHIISLICGIYNMPQMNLSMKEKQNHGHREQTGSCQGGGGGEGKDWEFGVGRCRLLHLEWINNKVLLYSTGIYNKSPGMNHNGKEY